MENPNYEETLRLADESVRSMFPAEDKTERPADKEQTTSPAIAKFKKKAADKAAFNEHYENLEARHKAAGIIHREHHNVAVPVIKSNTAVMYLNPMLPMYLEGYMESRLKRIQGKPI